MTKDAKTCVETQSCSVPVRKDEHQRSRYNPVLALQHEVNKLFNGFVNDALPSLWHSSERILNISPAIDVAETDKDIRVTVELPGMDAKDVNVTIAKDRITIRGDKSEEKKEEKSGYFRQERSYGEFQRAIALPDNVITEKAEASIAKGILTVTIPKKEDTQSKTRKLEVKQAA